jgi:2-polyprenyl-3-methyl-5-hydroxy-6-metoxy-1,4-benzoquinol methylase
MSIFSNKTCDGSQLELVQEQFSQAKAYADEYQEKTPLAHFYNTRIRRVSELLSGFEEGRVLDVGCGPAVIGRIFRGKPIRYHGVDVSAEMLRVCDSTFGGDAQYNFSIGSIEALGFQNNFFDVVLCMGVWEYVRDSHAAVREVARVLKPNGILIATMLNAASPYRLWQSYGYWKLRNGMRKLGRMARGGCPPQAAASAPGGKRPCSVHLGAKAFQQLLTEGGLQVEDVLYYDFNLIPAPLDAKIASVSVALSSRLEFLGRSWLKFLGTGFMVTCRKPG